MVYLCTNAFTNPGPWPGQVPQNQTTMTIYNVTWEENGKRKHEELYTLNAAKKLMHQHPGATGSKTKVYSNGEWVNCGEITLKGSNATFIANSPRNMKKANY